MTVELSLTPARKDADLAFYKATFSQSLVLPEHKAHWFSENLGRENITVAYHGQTPVGGYGIYKLGQWFGGRSVPMAGVSGVAVRPDKRRGGLAEGMLAQGLKRVRAEGWPVATLYASTQRLYRKLGFEQAGYHEHWTIPLHAVKSHTPTHAIQPLGDHGVETIHQMDQDRGRRGAGLLDRSEAIWNRVWRDPEGSRTYAYLLGPEKQPTGYVIYSQTRAAEDCRLNIRDFVALDGSAWGDLLAFLGSHSSIISQCRLIAPPTGPLQTLLSEQSLHPDGAERWMLRILDVKGALEARGYPQGLDTKLALHVKDPLIHGNNGVFHMRVTDGRATVERQDGGAGKTPGDNALHISVRFLAPLYSGYLTPHDLVAAGELEGPEAAQQTAEQIFAGPLPWCPDFF